MYSFKYTIVVFTVLKICNFYLIQERKASNNLTTFLERQYYYKRNTTVLPESKIEAAIMILTSFYLLNTKDLFNNSHYIKFDNTQDPHNYLRDFIASVKTADVNADFKQLVSKHGIRSETHYVTTEDGYVLTVFRLPKYNGPPILLMHGLLGSSDDFLLAGEQNALAYLLARDGYDVWLGNARGNKYSRKHKNLNPAHESFWDFSWHEMGLYDLPAIINYILDLTQKATLKYIGHCQGTTAFFVMASELPEFNKKVKLMIALSPVAFMSRARSPILRLLLPITYKLSIIAQTLGVHEFLPNRDLTQVLKKTMCGEGLIEDIVCNNAMYLVFGCNFQQLNMSNLPVILGHLPAGASVKQFAHYAQGILSGEFRRFDYGIEENIVKYGSDTPPKYNLEDIVAATSLFFSDNDWMADLHDVACLKYKMKNVIDMYKVPSKGFNHLDFILAKDVRSLINDRILYMLRTI